MAAIEMGSQCQSTKKKTLKVTRLDGENLRIDHGALREVFTRPELEGKKFAIISITGKMRTGKSFLMNFVLRYLRRRGWENEEWMGDGDYAIDADELPFAGGTERCTTGIRIFDEIFEVPIPGEETMMVMLMDTQGLFDNETPEVVNKSLLTLTTLMSSVQIFNTNNSIDSQSMEYLKTCVDFALRTAKASPNPGVKSEGYMKLQNLMFLVRDFPEDDNESFGLESGNKYLQRILSSKEGGDELVKIRSRIKESFDRVEGFALPHPGLKATKKNFSARNEDIKKCFRVYVKQFVEHIMNPLNLVAKRSSTKAITPREMMNMIAACDRIFADKMIDAQNMMKMNEKTYFSALCQEAIMEYDNLMKDINYQDIDEDGLQQKHDESKEKAIQELKKAEFFGEDDTSGWKEQYMQHFSTQCRNHFANTVREYEIQEQDRELKTTGILLKYESDVKSRMSEPLSDADFEELHEQIKQDIHDTCDDSEVLKTVFDRMIKVYESLKEENKRNREKTEKKNTKLIRRLSLQSKMEWDEFVKTSPDDEAMLEKKEKIFSTSFSVFSAATEQSEAGCAELAAELNRRYRVAKRENEQHWNLKKQSMDNEAEKIVLENRKRLNKLMVDRYIKENEIKKSFSQTVDAESRSERAKQYFRMTLKRKCDDAMKNVLKENKMNKKSNDILLNDIKNVVLTVTVIVAGVAFVGGIIAAGATGHIHGVVVMAKILFGIGERALLRQ